MSNVLTCEMCASPTPAYISTGQFASLMEITEQKAREMCRAGKVDGAEKIDKFSKGCWRIPYQTAVRSYQQAKGLL